MLLRIALCVAGLNVISLFPSPFLHAPFFALFPFLEHLSSGTYGSPKKISEDLSLSVPDETRAALHTPHQLTTTFQCPGTSVAGGHPSRKEKKKENLETESSNQEVEPPPPPFPRLSSHLSPPSSL